MYTRLGGRRLGGGLPGARGLLVAAVWLAFGCSEEPGSSPSPSVEDPTPTGFGTPTTSLPPLTPTPAEATPTQLPVTPSSVPPTLTAALPTQPDPGATPTEPGATLPASPTSPSTPTAVATPTAVPCAPPSASLDALAARFTTDVYPLMVRDVGGCAGCHYPESGRLMTLGPTGEDSFYRIRAGGFLNGGGPGTLLARVKDTGPSSMPLGGPHWTEPEIAKTECLVEDLVAFEVGGALAADEEFPPQLLEPYAGPPFTDFDNRWLSYEQLKGRVGVQFDDDWIRDGVDNFQANIALFGGADFETTFTANRQPTAEYLIGLDLMATDVCQTAADAVSGPFTYLDLDAAIEEELPSAGYFIDTPSMDPIVPDTSGGVFTGGDGKDYALLWSNGKVGFFFDFPIDGVYRIAVQARGDEAGPDLPEMVVAVDNEVVATFEVPEVIGWRTYEIDAPVLEGDRYVSVSFTNDFYSQVLGDRNLYVESVIVEGPQAGTTSGAVGARAAARERLGTLFERLLYRAPVVPVDPGDVSAEDELGPLYQLLIEAEELEDDRRAGWSAVCELLLSHPDFLFTRPPFFDRAPAAERERLIFLRTALDLLNRPPTEDEWARFDDGEPRMDLVAEWLESAEFLDNYFHQARLRFESDGTTLADEPARIFTWLFLADHPIEELLTGTYTVNPQFQQRDRPDHHGPTGVLTTAGYIHNKPGLPHYNYAARVLADFMGYVFEVPPEIVDSRAGSTAATTVDPDSICFSCHQLLTPLAHQRLRWTDDGDYRDVDEDGQPIDDSDRDLVEGYPYKGSGMAAFSAQAVRKERFTRRMVNTQAEILLGRPLRVEEDERDLYQTLYTIADQGQGTFRDLMEILLESESYTYPPGGRYAEEAP